MPNSRVWQVHGDLEWLCRDHEPVMWLTGRIWRDDDDEKCDTCEYWDFVKSLGQEPA